ncbi:MAG: 2OG-Fe(II) oxygenase [Deltaproteobacteria bacterium]|nr:2OG-Fe(II) oxygenase [Deltaproteobacteria bacterium]
MPHCPTTIHDVSGRKVLVFDGLFDERRIANFCHVLMQLPYERRESFDGELNAILDNEAFMAAPFLYPVLCELLAEHRSGLEIPERTELSHVYAAATGRGEQPQIHMDLESPDALTFLYYGNACWRRDWQGETVFYDAEGQAAVVVSPRPGRLVMFHSNIAHRGGAPHRDAPTFRYAVSAFYYPQQ